MAYFDRLYYAIINPYLGLGKRPLIKLMIEISYVNKILVINFGGYL